MNILYLIELFAGIGSQAKALENLEIPFVHYRVVEWDKYAIKSYNKIHNTNFETQDITKIKGEDLGIVDTDKKDYLLTYSFPCTDLSKAGKMEGMSKGSNTRSGLLWEVERLLNELDELPQYLLMENVPDVIGKKNIKDFALWIEFLESKGYKNYYECLNAKDYGIPQNRNRCFMVSILKTKNQVFQFPKPFELKLRLKDMLEDEVDEKYYLSERALKGALNTTFECSKLENRLPKNDIIPTLCARDYKDPKLILVGNMAGGKWDKINESARRVYSEEGLAPTIHTCQGGNTEPKVTIKEYANYITWEDSKGRLNTQDHRAFMPERISGTVPAMERGVPKILIPEATKQGYAIATEGDGVYINRPHQKRGVVQKGMIQTLKTSGNDVGVIVRGNYSPSGHNASRIVDKNGLSPTVMENHGTVTAVVVNPNVKNINNENDVFTTLGTNCGSSTSAGGGVVKTNLEIRKLTPKECWRLMGFSDDDFEKASKVNSNTQLYKQAGNSIVVNVLMEIFKKMFIDTTVENYQTNLFDYI